MPGGKSPLLPGIFNKIATMVGTVRSIFENTCSYDPIRGDAYCENPEM